MSLAAQKATVQQCAAVLRTWDIPGIQALRSDDFIFTVQPSQTLKSKPQTKAENEAILHVLKQFMFEIRDEIHDIEHHKAVVTFSSTAGTTVGLASFQGVLVMRFTEDRTKIAEMEEFTDSVAMLELMGKMQAAGGVHPAEVKQSEQTR